MNFEDYQEKAKTTAIYPSIVDMVEKVIADSCSASSSLNIPILLDTLRDSNLNNNPYYPALGLAGEAGEIANKVKKIMRDNNGIITDEFRKDIKKELGDVLWYVAACCNELDINMQDVASDNIEKLFSRKERGVIQGSGDER